MLEKYIGKQYYNWIIGFKVVILAAWIYIKLSETNKMHDTPYLDGEPAIFLGRDDMVKEVDHLVSNGQYRVVLLTGPPIVGKTTLAVKVGHHRRNQGWRVGMVEARADTSLDNLADQFAARFNTCFDDQENKSKLDQMCMFIKGMKHPTLIILDNVEDYLQDENVKVEFQKMVGRIATANDLVMVMCTSREDFEIPEDVAAITKKVNPLDDPQAVEVLNYAARPRVHELGDLSPLVGTIGGFPGLLLMFGAILRDCPELTVKDLVREIESNANTFKANFPASGDKEFYFIRMESSFKYLQPDLKKLFSQLSVFPQSFDLKALSAITKTSTGSLLESAIKTLTSRYLISEKSTDTRFELHRIIQDFAGIKLMLDGQEFNRTESEFTSYFLGYMKQLGVEFAFGKELQDKIRGYHTDASNIKKALHVSYTNPQYNLQTKHLETIADARRLILYAIDEREQRGIFFDSIQKLAKELNSKLYPQLLYLFGETGDVSYYHLNKLKDLEDDDATFLKNSNDMVNKNTEGDTLGYAYLIMARAEGRPYSKKTAREANLEAVKLYTDKALEAFGRSGNKRGQILTYCLLGFIHKQRNEMKLSAEEYHKAVEVAQKMEGGITDLGYLHYNEGYMHSRMGEDGYQAAIDCFLASVDAYMATIGEHRRVGASLLEAGVVYQWWAKKEKEKADKCENEAEREVKLKSYKTKIMKSLEILEKALAVQRAKSCLHRETGDSLEFIATNWFELGKYENEKQPGTGMENFEKALPYAKDTITLRETEGVLYPFHRQTGEAYKLVGDITWEMGKLDESLKHYAEAAIVYLKYNRIRITVDPSKRSWYVGLIASLVKNEIARFGPILEDRCQNNESKKAKVFKKDLFDQDLLEIEHYMNDVFEPMQDGDKNAIPFTEYVLEIFQNRIIPFSECLV